jgi:hypothetical protein
MTVVSVNSGAISQVEYHNKKKTLEVLFRDGSSAVYKNLDRKVYEEMMEAESIGKYFNYNIRGVYEVDTET